MVEAFQTAHTPESLLARLEGRPGRVLLRSALFDSPRTRYSFLTADPFLTLSTSGSLCRVTSASGTQVHYGNPWRLMDVLMSRYELLDQADLPFPLGGCFGYWGYDLKHFVEPGLPRRAVHDLELPDAQMGFYDSLVVFDHRLDKCWIIASGLQEDGSRCDNRARDRLRFWQSQLRTEPVPEESMDTGAPSHPVEPATCRSNLPPGEFVRMVKTAQDYIRAGDIYQVNLAHRLSADIQSPGVDLFHRLTHVSPAPYAAYLDCGSFELVSSSPELFLRLSGAHMQTRPIKGTRPRSPDPTRDTQLTYELQTSPKEMAELVMITDLLRNDLGKVCEYGSIQVPELAQLERYPQVQHLVSTVEGHLREELTHFQALASCFPGGSITGAPKIRAMEIIDELEPVARGPYTGCLGYLGFNRESQVNIMIRTAISLPAQCHFHVGAGIVADSDPQAEYAETMAKAAGFLHALRTPRGRTAVPPPPISSSS